jgi:nucleotide-binding universal stress UspA family protein
MAIKDILVHVDNSKACESRIRLACRMAQQGDAHLTGLYVVQRADIPLYVEAAIPVEILAQADVAFKERARQARTQFEAIVGEHTVLSEWRTSEDELTAALTDQTRYVDLAVLGQSDPDDNEDVSDGLADHVALESGRPIMVVPYIGAPERVGEHVIVAWNNSRESARAINDALPILRGAKRVEVVAFDPRVEAYEIACADISLHLSRHGVKAEAHAMAVADIEVGDALLSRSADSGADLIVMGAYGHSRFREVVLGGVTRHLLAHMTVPVLMSH